LIGNVSVLLISFGILIVASDFTIGNAIKISEMTGFGKTIVGFVLVGFSTSLANLSVSFFAIINPENVGIAVGNVLGSNIVNIALTLGVCILFVVLKRPRYPSFVLTLAKEEMGSLNFGLFIASIIPLSLLYIGYASRFVGIILVSIFVFSMAQIGRKRSKREEAVVSVERSGLRRRVSFALASAIAVVIVGFFIVESSSFIATSVGVPPVIIGATAVAFGTSLPAFFASTSSVRRGHLSLAMGNIIGECFINITLILGVALMASFSTVNIAAFSNLVLFSLITNLFLWFFLSNERISWREGALLLFLYAVFLVVSFGGYRG